MKKMSLLFILMISIMCTPLMCYAGTDGLASEQQELLAAESFLMNHSISRESLSALKQQCGKTNPTYLDSFYSINKKNGQNALYSTSVINLVNQAQAYGFSETEIQAYMEGLIKSSDKTLDDYTFSNRAASKNSDHVRPFHDDGAGYEVQSLTGYKESTAFGVVGNCKTNRPTGEAGYMFYTVGKSNGKIYKSNDYGIGYMDGKWRVFVSGKFTGWDDKSPNYPIYAGQKIYLDVSLVGDMVRMRVLDGNNFSKVFWDKSYSTNGFLTADGKGVIFNRQITLCDDKNKLGSGIYIKNAEFSQSYLYSTSGYSNYSASNTASNRRGRFKANWTEYSNVTVHSSSKWHAEKISIQF